MPVGKKKKKKKKKEKKLKIIFSSSVDLVNGTLLYIHNFNFTLSGPFSKVLSDYTQ